MAGDNVTLGVSTASKAWTKVPNLNTLEVAVGISEDRWGVFPNFKRSGYIKYGNTSLLNKDIAAHAVALGARVSTTLWKWKSVGLGANFGNELVGTFGGNSTNNLFGITYELNAGLEVELLDAMSVYAVVTGGLGGMSVNDNTNLEACAGAMVGLKVHCLDF